MNRYLIVYQKWRNWTQRAAGDGTLVREFKATNTNPRSTVSSPRGTLCQFSPLLIEYRVYVHYSLTRLLVFQPRPK